MQEKVKILLLLFSNIALRVKDHVTLKTELMVAKICFVITGKNTF